jgi:hypothetical protein
MRLSFIALASLLANSLLMANGWAIKQVAYFGSGVTGPSRVDLVCGDFEHDGLPVMSFWHSEDTCPIWSWQFWKYQPMNRYVLVKSETCFGHPGEPPPGFWKGTFLPTDAGQADDGMAEILGVNEWNFGDSATGQLDSVRSYLCLYKSRDRHGLPDTLIWMHYYSSDERCPYVWFAGDLDGDGQKKILFSNAYQAHIFEDSGGDQYDSVWTSAPYDGGYGYAFGDFDMDGRMDFATVSPVDPYFKLLVHKCTGKDQYTLVDSTPQDLPGGNTLCSGHNLDGAGKNEFFVDYDIWNGSQSWYVPCMYEADGQGGYNRTIIDTCYTLDITPSDVSNIICADIDGDGRQELLVSWDHGVNIYKWIGGKFQKVWSWSNPQTEAQVRCYDMNDNGYPDIIISGGGQTRVFEMEAIRVLRPNGGEAYRGGDTCRITWETFNPPRCDSVSLFLRTDSTWRLDTIAHGLPPSDTTYLWPIPPDLRSDYCHVVAIAYGPGWQYDESDTFLTIRPLGVEESEDQPVLETKLVDVFPNPITDHAVVSFQLSQQEPVRLRVYDVSGRVVTTLASGIMKSGRYSRTFDVRDSRFGLASGIYFLAFDALGCREARKLVIAQ